MLPFYLTTVDFKIFVDNGSDVSRAQLIADDVVYVESLARPTQLILKVRAVAWISQLYNQIFQMVPNKFDKDRQPHRLVADGQLGLRGVATVHKKGMPYCCRSL